MSNYRAVSGPITTPDFVPDQDTGGVLFHNSRVRVVEITDGTSSTLAIGECMYDEETGKTAALWAGMTGLRGTSVWVSDVMWYVDADSATINGPALALNTRNIPDESDSPDANRIFPGPLTWTSDLIIGTLSRWSIPAGLRPMRLLSCAYTSMHARIPMRLSGAKASIFPRADS